MRHRMPSKCLLDHALRVLLVVAVAALVLAAGPADAGAPAGGAAVGASTSRSAVPVYAYFYQWFNPSSWSRAKIDYPLAGRYSSDDRNVLRQQIAQAEAAGLSGFLTSWKSTDTLNRRLQILLQEARPRHFDVGVVYEALDFHRQPLPIAVVQHDMVELVTRWGAPLTSRYFGRPVIIWTGTQDYSTADIRRVRSAVGTRAYLLASAKSAAAYQRVAPYVDGDAYYWSSANPGTAYTQRRLNSVAAAVHEHHGIWLAPALAGFDGRTLGHSRVVSREHGQTLIRSLDDAYASHPDAIGVISWNEWSENTYVEPGHRYGRQELDVLAASLPDRRVDTHPATHQLLPREPGWTGLRAGSTLAGVTLLAGGLVLLRNRRRGH